MEKGNLKITFFSVLPPFRGGIAQFSQELRKSLAKKAEVDAFTFQQQYPNFLFPGKSQVEEGVAYFDVPRIVSTFRPWTYFSALRAFRKSNGSIFLTNYWMTFFGPMMGLWAKFLPAKTVKLALIHNLIPHEKRFFDPFFNRIFIKYYDGFIVLSESVKQDVLDIDPSAKVLVLSHPSYQQYGVKMNKQLARHKLGLDPTKKTLLFFGLIRPYKGLKLLLEAFSQLDDSFQLVIAGEVYGDQRMYDELIEQSQNPNIVFHAEFIPNERVQDYFSCADLCVLPYLSATQSGIKAMSDAFALPVLVSKVGGLAEEIHDGINGFVMKEMNGENMAIQIREIFAHSALYQVENQLTANIKETEKEWGDFADQLLHFSREIQHSKN